MELTLTMRLRIAASVGIGVVLIGLVGWQLAAPEDPLGVLSILEGSLNLGGAIALVFLAFVAGFAAYFASWPYGRQIGILAVPSGLALWGLRCGSVADLLRPHVEYDDRMAVFSALKWEPLFWLALVAVGIAAVMTAARICPSPKESKPEEKKESLGNRTLNAGVAVAGSIVIAMLGIRLFARDVAIADPQLGHVVGQPPIAQIAFAAFLSFGIASFAVKRLLDAEYFWPVAATGLITVFSVMLYVKQDAMEHMTRNWPVLFFSKAVLSVLPIQMVAFGTLGAIWGYWIAVRYAYWRKHG